MLNTGAIRARVKRLEASVPGDPGVIVIRWANQRATCAVCGYDPAASAEGIVWAHTVCPQCQAPNRLE